MIQRVISKPYDSFGLATFVIDGTTVYTSHFGGYTDADGRVLPTIQEQTRQTFANLDKALQDIGLGLPNLLKVTVILRNISDFAAMDEVWHSLFPSGYPARTTITSDFVDADCLIQVEAIASTEH